MKSKYKTLGAFALFCIAFNPIHAVDGYVAHEKMMFLRICDDSSYDPEASYDWKKENVEDDIFSISEEGACWVKIQGDNPGTAKIIALKDGTECGDFDITCIKIKSTTDVVLPSDQTRTRIGVAEKVKLEIEPSGLGSANWTIKAGGNSTLSASSGTTVNLYAHDEAETLTVEASLHNTKCELDFDVIAPQSVELVWAESDGKTVSPYLGLAYFADVYIGPPEVNFINAKFSEGACRALVNDYFSYESHDDHAESSGEFVLGHHDASKGTVLGWQDRISGRTKNKSELAYSNGSFIWNIPFRYSAGSVSKEEFKIVTQMKSLALLAGSQMFWELSIIKAGSSDDVSE